MNREDLRELSNLRLQEVRALRAAAQFDGAYYLAGYVVELGLKAVIAKATRRHDFPDLGLARESHIHDLQKLVNTAGLTTALLAESQADARMDLDLIDAGDVVLDRILGRDDLDVGPVELR